MHKAAKGQDLGQSGRAGFSCGQGIPSDMEAMSSIAPAGAAAIASDGAAMGTIRRLATARIDSRRNRTGQNFTLVVSHMLRCNKRADRSRCREDAAGNGHGYPLRPMLREQVRRHDRGCDRGNWPMPSGSQFRRPTSGAKLAGTVTQRTVVLRRFHVSARGAVGSGKFLVCQAASWRSVAILNRPSSTLARTVATQ